MQGDDGIIDIGLLISFTVSVASLYGVWLFNQRRDYTGARMIWMITNPLFSLYFLGRVMSWWNGGLGDIAMMAYFLLMTASNAWGMK
jgi:hypothetical protein